MVTNLTKAKNVLTTPAPPRFIMYLMLPFKILCIRNHFTWFAENVWGNVQTDGIVHNIRRGFRFSFSFNHSIATLTRLTSVTSDYYTDSMTMILTYCKIYPISPFPLTIPRFSLLFFSISVARFCEYILFLMLCSIDVIILLDTIHTVLYDQFEVHFAGFGWICLLLAFL